MKSFSRFLAFALLATAFSTASFAVTKNEMDQARVEAAKLYVRFANNQSGYLDDEHPASLADLQRVLKNDKDRENLKTFVNLPVTGDYAGWDKDKMVTYWSKDFLDANKASLNADVSTNQLYRQRVMKAVSSMKVTEPAPAPAPETTTPSPEQVGQPTEQTAPAPEQSQDPIPEELLEQNELGAEENVAQANEEAAAEQAAQEEAKAIEEEDAKDSSNTWVYIMVLSILVVIVIALVMYASKTMKGKAQPVRSSRERERRAESRQRVVADDGAEERRERYAEAIAEKNDEIRMLSRQLNELNDRVSVLRQENQRLKDELESERAASAAAVRASSYAPVAPPAESSASNERYMPLTEHEHNPRPADTFQEAQPAADEKVIYLGRVNSRGIFVRADRTMKPGMSVYRLATANGLTGTFTVVRDQSVVDTVFEDPGKWLVGGCVSKDIFNTDGRNEIITTTPGTAVFEDGAWRVIRKAQIRYE